MASRILNAALTFALLLTPLRASAEMPQLTGLDPCTVVAVEMLQTVSSTTAKPGDFFRFQTINAVTAKARVVIPARTMGYGIVAIASSAGRGGRAGTLVLEPRYLVLPSGYHLGVVLDHRAADLSTNGRSGDMPSYLGSLPVVGMAVGVFNYFHHGRDVQVNRGTIFPIFPSDRPVTENCQKHPAY